MAIGVDIDEVLVPMLEYHCQFLNRKHGLNLTKKDFYSYNFWEVYNVTKKQAIEDFLEFAETEECEEMQPFLGALKGVDELKEFRELYVITSRQLGIKDMTDRWLDRHFPGRFSKRFFGNSYNLELGKTHSKLELCKKNNIEVMIEDSPKNASEVASEIPVVLFDKPWNQNVNGELIYRVYGWEEIVKKTKQILNLSSQS
ncbi:MAG: hypothetical protein PVG65_04270 [Candidatus Thorarchaeota archaeon]|jgi:uncharacterized HAD superfamily protein